MQDLQNTTPRKKISDGCLSILVISLIGITWAIVHTWPTTKRYRYMLEVNTPQGMRSGSSILEVTSRKEIRILPDQHLSSSSERGEAVAVDLPNKQTLFALLEQDGSLGFGYINGLALGPDGSPRRSVGARPTEMKVHIGGPNSWMGVQEGIPMLVRFRDIRDPSTIEKVDPDNLAASFGKGYSLSLIHI